MSFLVAINGQFTPLSQTTSPRSHREVPNIRSTSESSDVLDFREILEEQKEGHSGKAFRAIQAYEKGNQQFEEQKKRLYARDLMSSPVKTISETALASEARKILKEHGFRHLPVLNSMSIITGMISDREIIDEMENKTCTDIMLKSVVVAEEQTSVHELASIFLNEKINALPIVNHKREMTGIITLSDILQYVINSTPFLGRA